MEAFSLFSLRDWLYLGWNARQLTIFRVYLYPKFLVSSLQQLLLFFSQLDFNFNINLPTFHDLKLFQCTGYEGKALLRIIPLVGCMMAEYNIASIIQNHSGCIYYPKSQRMLRHFFSWPTHRPVSVVCQLQSCILILIFCCISGHNNGNGCCWALATGS